MSNKKNVYLAAGGNRTNPNSILPVFKMILLQSGKSNLNVAYIGTANGDSKMFFKFSASIIKKAGASKVTHVHLTKKNADISRAESILREADAVFMSGGDVDEGMLWLNKYNIVPLLKDLYNNGILFFGLSAGSIMLGTQWVRWRDPNDDSTAELFDCIGIAPVLCDTHSEKDKWDELRIAVKLLGRNGTGYGIPTGGVLCIAPDAKIAAIDKPVVCYENRSGKIVKDRDVPILDI